MRYVATIEKEGKVTIDGQPHVVDMRRIEPLSLYSLLVDNLSHEAFIEERDGTYSVILQGKLYAVQVQDEQTLKQAQSPPTPTTGGGEIQINAPLPGLVMDVVVVVGQNVRAGETLLILESMKMENHIHAPHDGVVEEVHVSARDQVDRGQALLTMSS
jgi:biotin carboxyl carrier protein